MTSYQKLQRAASMIHQLGSRESDPEMASIFYAAAAHLRAQADALRPHQGPQTAALDDMHGLGWDGPTD